MERLRCGYTEVWVADRNLPLIRFADRVRSIGASGLELVGITESPAFSELERFDSIVSWYGSNREEFRDAVSHLPFEFFPALPDGTCHAVDFYMRQVGGPDGAVPRIECKRTQRNFIACHPFSGSAKKNWPLANFIELSVRLPEQVRFCVGPEQHFAKAARMDNLYELANWLASARAYVGNDCGVSHIAAAVGTPVVALFGPSDPLVWAPRGPQVRVIHRDPIDQINIEEVLQALC